MSTIEVAFPVIPAEQLEAMWETAPSDTLTITTQGVDFMTEPIYFSHYPKTTGEVVQSRPVRFEITVKEAQVDGWHANVRNTYLTGPWGGRKINVIRGDSIDCTLALKGDEPADIKRWWRR